MEFLHVRLKVRDIERSIRFYTQYFGFTCDDRSTSGRGTQLAFLAQPGGGTEIELAYLPWDPDFQLPEDIFHLAFRVKDMDAFVAQLQADQVPITEEISTSSSGRKMAFIADPDGYEIELLS